MSLPTNFFIGRGGGGGSLYDFEEIYMQPSSPSTSSDLRQGWNSLAYFSNPNGTTPSATIAATTTNPDTGDPYFARHAAYNKFQYVVPESRTYNFEIQGAQGGSGNQSASAVGGRGAKLVGTLNLEMGDILHLTVGLAPYPSGNSSESAGGGGASVIYKANWDETADSGMTLLAIAGGGGGAAHLDYGPYVGGNASFQVSGPNNGGWNQGPPNGDGMVVNTFSGGGGLGGNSSPWSNHFGASVAASEYGYYVNSGGLNTQQIGDGGMYNGVAGGAGWLQTGHPGHNGAYGGISLYTTAYGGNGGTSNNTGGFGGGGAGRNTSGGGGGGYIGGSGGYYTNENWSPSYTLNRGGALGGTSYFNTSLGSITSAGLGPTTNYLSQHNGYIRLY